MNRDRFAGLCRQLSGRVKLCWGSCTGNPLTVAAGNHDLVAGRMRERYGVSREEAARQLKALRRRLRDGDQAQSTQTTSQPFKPHLHRS